MAHLIQDVHAIERLVARLPVWIQTADEVKRGPHGSAANERTAEKSVPDKNQRETAGQRFPERTPQVFLQ